MFAVQGPGPHYRRANTLKVLREVRLMGTLAFWQDKCSLYFPVISNPQVSYPQIRGRPEDQAVLKNTHSKNLQVEIKTSRSHSREIVQDLGSLNTSSWYLPFHSSPFPQLTVMTMLEEPLPPLTLPSPDPGSVKKDQALVLSPEEELAAFAGSSQNYQKPHLQPKLVWLSE